MGMTFDDVKIKDIQDKIAQAEERKKKALEVDLNLFAPLLRNMRIFVQHNKRSVALGEITYNIFASNQMQFFPHNNTHTLIIGSTNLYGGGSGGNGVVPYGMGKSNVYEFKILYSVKEVRRYKNTDWMMFAKWRKPKINEVVHENLITIIHAEAKIVDDVFSDIKVFNRITSKEYTILREINSLMKQEIVALYEEKLDKLEEEVAYVELDPTPEINFE